LPSHGRGQWFDPTIAQFGKLTAKGVKSMSLSTRNMFSTQTTSEESPLQKFNKMKDASLAKVEVSLTEKSRIEREIRLLEVTRLQLMQNLSSLEKKIKADGEFPLDDLKALFTQKIQKIDPKIEILNLIYNANSDAMSLVLRTKEKGMYNMRDFFWDNKIVDDKFFGNESVTSTNQGFEYSIRFSAPGYDSHLTFEQVQASVLAESEVQQQNTTDSPTAKM
jgi:hypothetical protein